MAWRPAARDRRCRWPADDGLWAKPGPVTSEALACAVAPAWSSGASSINYGIKTGLNKAFIVGNETKEALIREDPRAAELLKPIVKGRDVHAYRVDWAGLWLIDTHNGYGDTARVDVDSFPGIRRHLDGFMPDLERRQDQGDTPYNLRSCAYYEKFRQPKLMWRDMSEGPRFAYSTREIFCNDKAFVLARDQVGQDEEELLQYLVGVLNSAVIGWYGRNITTTTGAGLPQWKKFSVETLPVPTASPEAAARVSAAAMGAVQTCDAGALARLQECLDCEVATAYGLGESELALLKAT